MSHQIYRAGAFAIATAAVVCSRCAHKTECLHIVVTLGGEPRWLNLCLRNCWPALQRAVDARRELDSVDWESLYEREP